MYILLKTHILISIIIPAWSSVLQNFMIIFIIFSLCRLKNYHESIDTPHDNQASLPAALLVRTERFSREIEGASATARRIPMRSSMQISPRNFPEKPQRFLETIVTYGDLNDDNK